MSLRKGCDIDTFYDRNERFSQRYQALDFWEWIPRRQQRRVEASEAVHVVGLEKVLGLLDTSRGQR